MPDFFPARESQLVTWAANFGSLLSATPTAFGCTSAQATAFQTLNSAFATSYATAQNRQTRSPANIIAKDQAKHAMIANARVLAGIIQKYPGTTDVMRSQLGLTVPMAHTPIPVPGSAPGLDIGTVTGWTVSLKLHDATSGSKRGKPAGVSGASVFSFVGAVAPDDLSLWKFEGNVGRTKVDVIFPSSSAPGTKVWLTAFWFNPRKQSGPASAPLTTNLQGGSVSMMAA